MLNISHYKIIAIGKIKKKWIQTGIEMYLSRLPGLKILEIKDNNQTKEEYMIKEIIRKNETLVTLNENGHSFTSKQLSKKLLDSSIEDSQKLYTEFNQFLLEDEID